MRSTLTLSLIAVTASLSAQLQNGGFEDLSSEDIPTYWGSGVQTITIGDSIVVDSAMYLLNSTDVHSGQHAVELRNAYDYTQDFGMAGLWVASPFEDGYGGFPSPYVEIVERPLSLNFWAKYAPVQGDSAYAEVTVLDEYQLEIGSGSLHIGGTVANYTAFQVPVTYTSEAEAAYITVRFITIVPGANAHLGTRLLVDDVEVDYMETGVTELSANTLGLSPNPATDQVHISGLGTGSPATVRVVSSTGRVERSADLLNGTLSVEGLSAGVYVLQVEQAGKRYQAPLMIAR